jgi:hypothetical protein
MMYRDRRKMTKTLLPPKSAHRTSRLLKGKKKRKETLVYVKWVIEEIKRIESNLTGIRRDMGLSRRGRDSYNGMNNRRSVEGSERRTIGI